MTIGDRIEERRKALKIKSQSALARKADMGQSTLNGLIRKPYRWSPFLPRLARELNTSVQYLVGETDDPDANAPPPEPKLLIQHVMLPVALPSEGALARMFVGLLSGLPKEASLDEKAQLLARRLPIGLSQSRDLLPTDLNEAQSPAADLATLHPEPQP